MKRFLLEKKIRDYLNRDGGGNKGWVKVVEGVYVVEEEDGFRRFGVSSLIGYIRFCERKKSRRGSFYGY